GLFLLFTSACTRRVTRSFPTRRSSDLGVVVAGDEQQRAVVVACGGQRGGGQGGGGGRGAPPGAGLAAARQRDGEVQRGWRHRKGDRKSTRLNSSHVKISYAVFCLKKKK